MSLADSSFVGQSFQAHFYSILSIYVSRLLIWKLGHNQVSPHTQKNSTIYSPHQWNLQCQATNSQTWNNCCSSLGAFLNCIVEWSDITLWSAISFRLLKKSSHSRDTKILSILEAVSLLSPFERGEISVFKIEVKSNSYLQSDQRTPSWPLFLGWRGCIKKHQGDAR